MSPIEIVYKTMFNHFVKKEGYSSSTHVIAGAATSLCNLLFLANCYFSVKLIFSNPIPISLTKIEGMLVAGMLIIINHFLLFVVFKFSKDGDGPNNLFNLPKEVSNLGWWIFGINLFLALAVPLYLSYYKSNDFYMVNFHNHFRCRN